MMPESSCACLWAYLLHSHKKSYQFVSPVVKITPCFGQKSKSDYTRLKYERVNNDKFWFLLYMAVFCQFNFHWQVSYNPMSSRTPNLHIFYSTLYCTLHFTLYCTLHFTCYSLKYFTPESIETPK